MTIDDNKNLLPVVLPPCPSKDEVLRLLHKYPPVNGVTYSYGTAGFRDDATVLECIMVRVGLLAAFRGRVGVMVTASHNDESYNGVKVADAHGGMMEPDGEELALQLARASEEQVWSLVEKRFNKGGAIHVGRDTRSHSPALTQLLIRAAQAFGASVVVHGVVTTPQLHHVVAHSNPEHLPLLIPQRPNVQGYFDLICHSYHNLLLTCDSLTKRELMVDCACGVGYPHLHLLKEKLQQIMLAPNTNLTPRNGPDDGPLNTNCGSEYVQKSICAPTWYDEQDCSTNYCAALDGDADRIVFFQSSPFKLLDGDKVAVLICDFLQEQLDAISKEIPSSEMDLKLGVVQTAYANGASTKYLNKVLGKDRVLIAKTGVKHVHATAHENFDIGVYFEANGHGTVLFGSKFYQFVTWAHGKTNNSLALRRLALLPSLVNQAVGDALSDLLLVDAILALKNWDLSVWDNLYQDLPSRQCKVKVKDRSMICTNENETRCLEPPSLQPALDAAMQEFDGSRSFVRPSGTENVVRIYAEALSAQDADALAEKAAQLVHRICEGTGELPTRSKM